jgi:ferredoxin
MNVQLIVDPDTCIGYGECVAADAEAVELDSEGCARVRLAELDRVRAERLCATCPVGAISFAATDESAA